MEFLRTNHSHPFGVPPVRISRQLYSNRWHYKGVAVELTSSAKNANVAIGQKLALVLATHT